MHLQVSISYDKMLEDIAESNKEGPIQCIFFSEFHADYGPRIVCQFPDDYISKDIFDAVSVYIIPKPDIQKRIVTNTILLENEADSPTLGERRRPPRGLKIVGYPNAIADKKYARNAFIFNVCLVCESGERTIQYEPVVRKASEWLVQMEHETALLSGREGQAKMPAVLRAMLQDLNSAGHAVLSVDGSVPVHLKVVRTPPAPKHVADHDVPVWVGRRRPRLEHWDMTSQQIIPHIKGVAHVAKISALADVEVQLVKACIRNLLYYGLVELTSIFQYSNTYVVTPEITRLYTERPLQEECCRAVARDECIPASVGHVFPLYCALTHSRTLRDLCTEHSMQALRVNERQLVQFGLLRGLIRRIHKYPVYQPELAAGAPAPSRFPESVYRLFDGRHSYDEICVRTGLSSKELDDRIERDPTIIVLRK
ncbi:GATOR complex protein NPRL2-like isoform X2 [Pollicipes pollicipes]|uniref:GATOR complex protein NPRL2-like isoform X2 n=1 Tax=Pollicipes pollicipes TaxID=41117 RepID=UPI001884B873|nr:GATOR complex protein NPRL2-like isoform X2 [Pollicipes pollicipes]